MFPLRKNFASDNTCRRALQRFVCGLPHRQAIAVPDYVWRSHSVWGVVANGQNGGSCFPTSSLLAGDHNSPSHEETGYNGGEGTP